MYTQISDEWLHSNQSNVYPSCAQVLARVVTSKPDQYSSTLKAPRLLVLKAWLMAVSLRLSTFPQTLLQTAGHPLILLTVTDFGTRKTIISC